MNMKWITGALVLMLAFAMSTRAEDPATKTAGNCTITGVVMKDGQAANGITVYLLKASEAIAGQKGAGRVKGALKAALANAVAQLTTDDDGKFVMSNLPAGDYVIIAGEKGLGGGRSKITVSDGESATITVEMKERKAGNKRNKNNPPTTQPGK